MSSFLQENIPAVVGLLVMAGYWFILNYRSVKGNIDTIDKKRAEKGLPPMTNDERQIVGGVLRTSVIHDSLSALVGGIVSIIVVYLLP